GIASIRSVNGSVVTRLHLGHGMIDDAVRFTGAEVLGGVPLQPGDLVDYTAVRDGPQGGWKALRVQKCADTWEDDRRASLDDEKRRLRPLIGTVTSFNEDGGYINQSTYFPCSSLWEGYIPMKGDWVQAKYLIDPTQWTSKAQCVAPLRYCRLDQACVTSVYAESGVVQDKVFFSLDSLLLPANYKPLPGDLVNLVMVESSQSLYSWRALCMAPCHQSLNASKPEVPLQDIFENKEGIVVSDYGKFGNLMIGETRELVFWIHFSRRKLPDFLPTYLLPQALANCVEAQMDVFAVQPCLGEVLSPLNMQQRFSVLLWLEELHAQRELQEFSISGALPKKGARCLDLDVPGLAEGRPHLIFGDRVLLKKPQRNGMVVEYISYVTEIHDETVSLRVNADFQHSYIGEPLDVEFCYNRLNMRRCHNALELTKDFGEILFPSRVIVRDCQWKGKWLDESDENQTVSDNEVRKKIQRHFHCFFCRKLGMKFLLLDGCLLSKQLPRIGQFFNPDLNPLQREAVKRILAGECRPIPYVLFGPPGTGKTITIIEAILQVQYSHLSQYLELGQFSRTTSPRLRFQPINPTPSPLACSNWTPRCTTFCPIAVFWCAHLPTVLQTSSASASIRADSCTLQVWLESTRQVGRRRVGHFTHVFLDEAGQATEPESRIPISFISERDGQIILAGDPCQLGPVIKSKSAAAFGLGVSMLERLMANPLYSRHDWGYNPRLVTKLVDNYRSHKALLTLPSKLFYRDELCVKAPRAVVDSLCQWKTLPKKGFPLIFHGVRVGDRWVCDRNTPEALQVAEFQLWVLQGMELREGNSPSLFNPVEAVQVMLYCCQLTKKLYNPVAVSEIGIIAPYRKQVRLAEKVRVLLSKVGLSDIKVGSVEEFQGQEFLVIIISTVRSNESIEHNDLQNMLGFLSNPKRFNVAVTRPKALLLIVGNPHILINVSIKT
ncbi:unnamed protein product, partial [Tetraodon nigroviridis]